jgi:hypothetical protein
MATWQAKCWLGSASGYQTLQVESNTFSGAQQQLRRIYGAEQIINLRQVSAPSGMITPDMPEGTAYAQALEGIFKLFALIVVLLIKGIVQLCRYLAKAAKAKIVIQII